MYLCSHRRTRACVPTPMWRPGADAGFPCSASTLVFEDLSLNLELSYSAGLVDHSSPLFLFSAYLRQRRVCWFVWTGCQQAPGRLSSSLSCAGMPCMCHRACLSVGAEELNSGLQACMAGFAHLAPAPPQPFLDAFLLLPRGDTSHPHNLSAVHPARAP